MIFNSLITQLVMLVLAIGIVITYVQPTFVNIGLTQSAIEQYKTESLKVDEVNLKLQSLISRVNNMSERDKKSLSTFMPDEIDHVVVSRDIYTMSLQSGAYLESVNYEGIKAEATLVEASSRLPIKHAFNANISGTYDQVKNFLGLLEKNNYPLEVHEFNLSSTETGLIKLELTIITYSRV
jgi:hypothetical protein